MMGRVFTEEWKRKISIAMKGQKTGLGLKRSDATKRQMSRSQMGHTVSDQTRLKISQSLKGRYAGPLHPMYGRPAPHGSGVGKGSYSDKGHWVRSTWERQFADTLFAHKIVYEYEPERFDLDGIVYWPDFYIPGIDTYVEIKGYMDNRSKEKIDRFRSSGKRLEVFCRSDFESLEDSIVNRLGVHHDRKPET